MRRVVFLAYHYPPVGGGGVQRNRRFVDHLPSFGWTPVVVTGTGSLDGRWTPSDPTIAEALPEGAELHRVAGPEPAPWSGLPRLLGGITERRDPALDWWIDGACSLGAQVGADCEAVLVSCVPYETAFAGVRLARELGLPWIADLQDPWALDEMWLYPSRWHHAIDRRRMRRLLGDAAAIVMNTPEAAARLTRAFPELGQRIVVSITNGFDADDFSGPAPVREDDRFRIVHSGTMHTSTGLRLRHRRRVRRILGGADPGLDMLPRSHVYLLEALERLAASDPELVAPVEVHLAGVLTDDDRRIADASPFARALGYRSHGETIDLVRSADLLFLPMHDLPPGRRAGLTPGKAYEYLASGRPILAAVPDGDARDMLEQAGTARLCRPADVDAMVTHLREALVAWHEERPLRPPDADVVARYERRALTGELASVLDATTGPPSGAVPASAAATAT